MLIHDHVAKFENSSLEVVDLQREADGGHEDVGAVRSKLLPAYAFPVWADNKNGGTAYSLRVGGGSWCTVCACCLAAHYNEKDLETFFEHCAQAGIKALFMRKPARLHRPGVAAFSYPDGPSVPAVIHLVDQYRGAYDYLAKRESPEMITAAYKDLYLPRNR